MYSQEIKAEHKRFHQGNKGALAPLQWSILYHKCLKTIENYEKRTIESITEIKALRAQLKLIQTKLNTIEDHYYKHGED